MSLNPRELRIDSQISIGQKLTGLMRIQGTRRKSKHNITNITQPLTSVAEHQIVALNTRVRFPLLGSFRLDLDTMPCKGKRPRSASSRAPVSDKIGAGAPIVIDGCKDRWTNVGLALRSVLPLDERCPLSLGFYHLLFCFRPAPAEWNNCFFG
eukprot:gene12025-8278_t